MKNVFKKPQTVSEIMESFYDLIAKLESHQELKNQEVQRHRNVIADTEELLARAEVEVEKAKNVAAKLSAIMG